MRGTPALVLFLALGLLSARAEDWKTTDGVMHRGVTVLSYTLYDVAILDADGRTETLPLSDLSPDLQKRFHYDPQRLAALTAQADARLAAAEAEPAQIYAREVTPAMQDAFLSRLKASIANRDYAQFRRLLYASADQGGWLRLQNYPPFGTLFSAAPRTYVFGPPWLAHDGVNPIVPAILPIVYIPNWRERPHASCELYVFFPKSVGDPGFLQSFDVQLGPTFNLLHIPLVVRDGKLLAAQEHWMIN